MFKFESNRLLREGEWTITQLTQEIYAILQKEILENDGSVTMNQSNPDSPSLIINQPPYSQVPAIAITRTNPDGTTSSITFGAQPDGSFDAKKDGKPIGVDAAAVPLSLIGRVAAGGPGESYTVQAWTVNPQISGGTPGVSPSMMVTAKQVQIDPTDTIPSGTFVFLIGYPDPVAVDSDGNPVRTWYMIVPTWL
jgi:hypothetical protein